jgi:hypothetical protein
MECWNSWLSPLRLILLTVNAFCAGACVALVATGRSNGPLVLLTVAVGLMLGSGLAGTLIAAFRLRSRLSS